MVNRQFKRIAGATLVAGGLVVSAASNAAIYSDNTAVSNYTGNGTGEIFLSVLDPTGNRSLNYDLGITVNDVRFNPASIAGTVFNNPVLLSFLADTTALSAVRWNMGGVSNQRLSKFLADGVTLRPSRYENFGWLISGTVTSVSQGLAQVQQTISKISQHISTQNAVVSDGNPSTDDFTDYAYDGTVFSANPNSPEYHQGANWGSNVGAIENGVNSEVAFGQSTFLYFINPLQIDGGDPGFQSELTQLGGISWRLTSQGLQAASPVPVPAGIWLMGTALAGLGGMLRKVRERAAASNC